jgi:hypothetical protein
MTRMMEGKLIYYPFNPTQADEDEAGDALFKAVLFIGGEYVASKAFALLKHFVKAKTGFNFTKTAATHMDDPGRMIPVQIIDDIIKAPLSVVKDPQGTNALMHYSQMYKNGKLYNVEVLHDKITNTIMHFKYTKKPLGPLPVIK